MKKRTVEARIVNLTVLTKHHMSAPRYRVELSPIAEDQDPFDNRTVVAHTALGATWTHRMPKPGAWVQATMHETRGGNIVLDDAVPVSRVSTEDAPTYCEPPAEPDRPSFEDEIISKALQILSRRMQIGRTMDSPQTVAKYLIMRAGAREDQHREVFTVLYLDSQHCTIDCVDEFVGTLTQASVYPREIVRSALTRNAAAVVLSHNHPSGNVEPSRADENLTQTLKSALALVDVRVLDHIITAGNKSASMAELGLI